MPYSPYPPTPTPERVSFSLQYQINMTSSQNNDLKFPIFPLPPPTNTPPHAPIKPQPSPFPSLPPPPSNLPPSPIVKPPPHPLPPPSPSHSSPPPAPKPPRPLPPPSPPHSSPPPAPKPPRPTAPPPPSPHVKPPPHPFPPPSPKPPRPPIPPPHPTSPPPPPAPAPGHHSTVIVIVFVSLGGLFFLAFLSVALFCLIKKKKKKRMGEKAEIIKFDEHKEVQEATVPGPNGGKVKIVTIEEDVHFDEKITKTEKVKEASHLHQQPQPHIQAQAIEVAETSESTQAKDLI